MSDEAKIPPMMPKEFPCKRSDDTVDVTITLTRFQYETLKGVAESNYVRHWLQEVLTFEFMNHKHARVCSACGWECWPVTHSVNAQRFLYAPHEYDAEYVTEPMDYCPKCDKKLSAKTDASPIFELYGKVLGSDRWGYRIQGMKPIRERLNKLAPTTTPKLLERPPAKRAAAS